MPDKEATARIKINKLLAINMLCFQVFAMGSERILSRAWLIDPMHTQVNVTTKPDGPSEPWNGETYVSFGQSENRSWEDAVQYGFVSASDGPWYTRTLQLLSPGDRIWVKAPGYGFVGVGRVTGVAQPLATFTVLTPEGERPLIEVAKRGRYYSQYIDNREPGEAFVPVRWLQTVPLDQGIQEVGLFGNQNSVCRPLTAKWRTTVE